MIFPCVITVGGKPITIKSVKSLDNYAEYRHDESEILVREDIATDPEKLRFYLRHEIAHAAFGVPGVAWMEKFEEEAVVRCLDGIFHPAWEALLTQLP